MNPKIYEFDAVIRKVEGLDGAYIEFPWDVRTEFGRGRAAVSAEFDGVLYSGSLVRMGRPDTFSACARTSALRSANNPAIGCMCGCGSGQLKKSDESIKKNTTKARKCRL